MEGIITVTNKEGGVIFSANIWTTLFMNAFFLRFSVDPKEMRVHIDGEEVHIPKVFVEDREKGGDNIDRCF